MKDCTFKPNIDRKHKKQVDHEFDGDAGVAETDVAERLYHEADDRLAARQRKVGRHDASH